MKPFADGEIIKECLTAVAEIGFPDKKKTLFPRLVCQDLQLEEELKTCSKIFVQLCANELKILNITL